MEVIVAVVVVVVLTVIFRKKLPSLFAWVKGKVSKDGTDAS